MGTLRTAVRPVLRGAVTRPVLAARVVLDRVGEDPARVGLRESPARALARSLADTGELSAAVAALPPGDRLRERYAGELRALSPRAIPAAPRLGVTGVRGRVLHMVTNALPYTQSGYTLRTHRIVRAQRAGGIGPHVVTAWGWPVRHGHLQAPARECLDGIPYHRLLPQGRIPAAADERLARGADAATELVRLLRPTVLHSASDHRNGAVALAVRERTGIPVVYEVRGFAELSWLTEGPGRDPGSERVRLARERETAVMLAADAVTTLSQTMRAELVARGIPPDRIVLTPNAVDHALLTMPSDGAAIRRDVGVGEGEFVVGAASKLAAYEGFDVLLEAAALLRDRGVAMRVVLAGEGPAGPALIRRAQELGLGPDRVLFLGRLEGSRAQALCSALDVFAVPRLDRPVTRLVTPLKPLEAMALGCPVLASDLPALRELTAGGTAAALVHPGDPYALAAQLIALAHDPAWRLELAAAGRDAVAEGWTWSRLACVYTQLYGSLQL